MKQSNIFGCIEGEMKKERYFKTYTKENPVS